MTRPQRSPEVSAEIESTRSSIVKASSTRQPVAHLQPCDIPGDALPRRRSCGSASSLGRPLSILVRWPVSSTLAPPGALVQVTPPGSLIPPMVYHRPAYGMDIQAVHCGFLPPFWVASVLGLTSIAPVLRFSGSSRDARRREFAWVSFTSDVSRLLRSSVCAHGSFVLVPSAVVSQYTTLAPPSLNSAVGCRHWVCASAPSQPLPPGDRHHRVTPLSSPVIIPVFIPSPSPCPLLPSLCCSVMVQGLAEGVCNVTVIFC
ncbi:hypothetical protein DPX16_0596 [Anabarilius grahami]|uniref:Uncharacterized protein n=1 Tax=Anabarilius grahami TaxID=495550 RepID=A0A3N0Z4M8_ANAGA|nr:hypothetical protein DPX16_0596 [Anabarilius grahami]